MARGRMVSKSFSTSQKRGALVERYGEPCPSCGGSLAEYAQTLYLLLIAHADDFGRQEGGAFTVRHRVDPLSPRALTDLTRALAALDEVELIQWFTAPDAPGKPVIAIVEFEGHQIGLHNRTRSKFPEPPGIPGNPREPSLQLNLTELNRTELKKKNAAPTPPTSRAKNGRPNVKQLTVMVRKDILPLHLPVAELAEAAKARAATLHLAYDSASITKAIAGAQAQARKGVLV